MFNWDFSIDCSIAKHWNKSIRQTSLCQKKNEHLDLTDIETQTNNNKDAHFHHDDGDDDDDNNDQGQTDESDESSEDEEEEFNPGDVILAKHDRIRYPAQICCFEWCTQ